jgi:hypothetical protein
MSQSDICDVQVNVVSSPESTSRNGSPEPDNYRIINRIPTPSITCFPVIKTAEEDKTNAKDFPKATATQKNSGSSTNFSISSILSRAEPTVKKNGFPGLPTSQHSILENSIGANPDSAMLSR